MCILSIKVPVRKKSGNLLYAPRISQHTHKFLINVSLLFSTDQADLVLFIDFFPLVRLPSNSPTLLRRKTENRFFC